MSGARNALYARDAIIAIPWPIQEKLRNFQVAEELPNYGEAISLLFRRAEPVPIPAGPVEWMVVIGGQARRVQCRLRGCPDHPKTVKNPDGAHIWWEYGGRIHRYGGPR